MNQDKIAKLAGTSVSTVSKALTGSKEISVELKNKIIDIAFKTGYFNEVYKRKRDYNDNVVIAVICPEIISPYYARIIDKIKKEVEKHHGKIAIYIDDFSEKISNSIVKTLAIRNQADGIVMLTSSNIKIKTGIPIIYFNVYGDNKKFDCFGSDNKKVMYDAVSYLKEQGHKDIGYIGEYYTMVKFENFKDALEKSGLLFNEDFSFISEERFEENGFKAGELFLKKTKRPTALIAAYDEIAMGFIKKLNDNNIKVPSDVSVMGINDISYSSYAQIPLTTIRNLDDEIYKSAINILYDKINGKDKYIHNITVKHKLIIRDTVTKIRG